MADAADTLAEAIRKLIPELAEAIAKAVAANPSRPRRRRVGRAGSCPRSRSSR
jgi:hypothetical protein